MKILDYIRETKIEMSHVVWPTRRQAIVFTAVVVIFSVGIAMYLGLFDYLFSLALRQII